MDNSGTPGVTTKINPVRQVTRRVIAVRVGIKGDTELATLGRYIPMIDVYGSVPPQEQAVCAGRPGEATWGIDFGPNVSFDLRQFVPAVWVT